MRDQLNALRCETVMIYFNDFTETRTGMLVRETDDRYCVHVLETREEIRFDAAELIAIDDYPMVNELTREHLPTRVFIDTNQ